MPSSSELRVLQALHQQLSEVLTAQAWDQLAAVDQRIRSALELLATRGQLSAEALAAKQQLKVLHGQARVALAEECERLRVLMLRHLQYAEGRSAYMRIDQF
jgi:hypothetical protein